MTQRKQLNKSFLSNEPHTDTEIKVQERLPRCCLGGVAIQRRSSEGADGLLLHD